MDMEIAKIIGNVLRNILVGVGTWVAQWVKHLILDFSSGHDHIVMRLSSSMGFVLGMEPD